MAPSSLSVRTAQPHAGSNSDGSLGRAPATDSPGARGKPPPAPASLRLTPRQLLGTMLFVDLVLAHGGVHDLADTVAQSPGNKNSTSTLSVATPTTATTFTPPSPASATTVVNSKKLPSKPSRKDSIISASGLKEKPDDAPVKGLGLSLGPTTVQPAASPGPSPSVASPANPGVDPLSQVRLCSGFLVHRR